LYEKLGSNELEKVAQRTWQFIVRSGKSTYLVNAQKFSTVTYKVVYSVPGFVFSGQTAIAE